MKYQLIRMLPLAAAILLLAPGCKSETDEHAPQEQASEQLEAEALATRPEHADPADWCAGHALPESMCTKCHPDLVPKYKAAGDWCAEHGFPESVCPKCNPMQPPGAESEPTTTAAEHAPGNGEWCAGHAIPESHCTKCHPELIPKFKAAGDWCAEHGFPESMCPICNPQTPPGGVAPIEGLKPGTKIIFKKDAHEAAVGIEVVEARKAPVGLGITAPARIEFNRNRLADVRAPVPGIVHDVRVDLGQKVEKGAALFVLESADVGGVQAKIQAAEQELETARANLERQKKLHENGLAAARQVEVARRDFQTAESRLGSLKNALRLAGASGASSSGRYTLRAPIAGSVVARPGLVGAFATEQTSLATIADTSTMWAMIDVPENESFALDSGRSVTLSIDGAAGAEFTGKITWISPRVDPRTRTVTVRAEIDNSRGRLRANQFALAEIAVAPDKMGVIVPRDAVQRLDGGTVVFVRLGEGKYEPRVVEVGRSRDEFVQVRGRLKPGEPVVTTGAFILKTELSRDSIGAGCCEVPGE
jgi:cobalt-zinc-cadmium efflux system membrane fusion protein